MSVNSKMTAIANATRALDGSTAAMTLDGIASKLGVEKTNVEAALAAIAEKGVTVPDGSTSDALASLIASIEAGGGEIKIVSGSFTPSEEMRQTRINHALGAVPKLAIVCTLVTDVALQSSLRYTAICGVYTEAFEYNSFIDYVSGGQRFTTKWITPSNGDLTRTEISYNNGQFSNADENDITVGFPSIISSSRFLAGRKYVYCFAAY